MNRYKVTKQLGDGTYGSVLKAQNKQTNEVVCSNDRVFSPTEIISYLFHLIWIDGNQKDEKEVL